MAETQPVPKDPIQTRSLSVSIFVSCVILMGTVVLAGYDEFVGRRPYKKYQRNFVNVYLNYLDDLLPKQEQKLAKLQESPEFLALTAEFERKQAKVDADDPEIAEQIEGVQTKVAVLQDALKNPRSLLSSLRYKLETARTEAVKDGVRQQMAEVKKEMHTVTMPGNGTEGGDVELTLDDMASRLTKASAEKAELERIRGELTRGASEAQKKIDEYVAKNLDGPTPDNVYKLMQKAEDGLIGPEGKSVEEILQIHIGELDWVDRCESCHVGTREPVDMTSDDVIATTRVGLDPDHATVYSSHPTKELLAIHPPDRFGCSMCHNGNGRSVSKVKLAHGQNKHWLFPLYPRENFDAGCVQCHVEDFQLEHAETYNKGKWLFFKKGCWGCHKYDGYDTQFDELQVAGNKQKTLQTERGHLEIKRQLETETTKRQIIDMKLSGLDTQLSEVARLQDELAVERQRVGPNLKNVRSKIKPEWLVPWLLSPKAFRPMTRMPKFFENVDEETAKEHATKIAAFVWQSGVDRDLPRFAPGDADKGKAMFNQRGCLGCHTMEQDGKTIGDGFAADLSRIGDKNNYDFVVNWIMNPDSGVMPNLRLTEEESRNIATYLMSLETNTNYPMEPQLNNPALMEEGLTLIRHYGCAGCHEIKGLESDGRIGVELSKEGSKPKERLDFGRLEHGFKRAGRYTHKAFFEEKLRKPGVYGLGKIYDESQKTLDHLKMPNFNLKEDEITALTTVLMGSIESEIPESFRYQPDAQGKAIREGWWVVRKYNCVGCHEIMPGEKPDLWSLPWFAESTADGAEQKPPSLVGIGFRTSPEWLARFLRNPAQHRTDPHRNGVRPYLAVRMPTFRFSEREIQKLVSFFGAIDSQPEPFLRPGLEPLSAKEMDMARALFKGVGCVKCHATGDPVRDAKMSAPYLTIAGDKLKAAWTRRWLIKPSVMLPGTKMPKNFSEEFEVRLKNGTSLIGTDIVIPAKGNGRMKLSATGETARFTPADVLGEPRFIRNIATFTPDNMKDYTGDFRELIVRYLHLHYDENEIPLTMPDE